VEPYLDLHIRANHVQLLPSLRLEEVQEVGDGGQQNAAAHPDRLGKLPLLNLQAKVLRIMN
jgi:hypothetical protein